MTPWVGMNIASALTVAAMAAFLMASFHDLFTRMERAALAMLGAAMILRLGPMIAKNVLETTSPYDDWSVSLLHASLVLAGLCVLRRLDEAYRRGALKRPE